MTLNLCKASIKEYLKGYISRNKKLFIISLAILVISAVIGVFISDFISRYMIELLKEIVNSYPQSTVTEEALHLFNNNLRVYILIMLGGFLFSVFSIFSLIVNGLILGYTFTLMNPLQFVVGIFPHGIFELTAICMSLMGAFIITKIEINVIRALFRHEFVSEIRNSVKMAKDVLVTFIISFIFLVIAAIIEAAVTPALLSLVI